MRKGARVVEVWGMTLERTLAPRFIEVHLEFVARLVCSTPFSKSFPDLLDVVDEDQDVENLPVRVGHRKAEVDWKDRGHEEPIGWDLWKVFPLWNTRQIQLPTFEDFLGLVPILLPLDSVCELTPGSIPVFRVSDFARTRLSSRVLLQDIRVVLKQLDDPSGDGTFAVAGESPEVNIEEFALLTHFLFPL